MKKRNITTLIVTVTAAVAPLFPISQVFAFNQGDLIDDPIFDNTNSMAVSQINDFLNSFSGSCISPSKGFSAPAPTGYNPTQGFLYGGNVSAGQVIYDAAQAYEINPQVLLTTIQKEQSLVTGSAGCSTLKYVGAAGYGCPDSGTTYNYSGLDLYTLNGTTVTSVSGTCVNSTLKAGFSQQVIHAAWLLKFGEQRSQGNINWSIVKGNWDNTDDPQTCYGGPMTQGTWQVCPSGSTVYYDGYTTIDGTSVHLANGATAALYWYTPHFSGNQNFDTIFSNWFGTLYASVSVSNIAWSFETLDGSTTAVSKTAGNFGSYSYTMTDSSGVLHVFYYDATDHSLKHAWSDSSGWHFETVDGAGGSNGQVSTNVGGFPKAIEYNGGLYVVYYDFQDHSLRISHQVSGTWYAQTIDGTGSANPSGPIAADVGQDISISTYGTSLQLFYFDATNGNLRHSWYDGATWHYENFDGDYGSVGGYNGDIGQGVNAQLLSPGTLDVFYFDATHGNLRHAWTDQNGWHFENLDGDAGSISRHTGDVGAYPTFAMNGGVLQLFYYNLGQQDLRHAWNDSRGWHFENLDGDAGSISRHTGDVGIHPVIIPLSTALNILYFDASTNTLRQAWADATGWHFADIDGADDAVSGLNEAIGNDLSGAAFQGTAQVYYYDNATGTFKHAWGALRY